MARSAPPALEEQEARRWSSTGTGQAAVLALAGYVAVRCAVLVWLFVRAGDAGRRGDRVLTKWDAQWYAGIAENGYGFVRTHPDGRLLADYAFFPLYPACERFVSRLTGLGSADAGLLVSALAGVAAAAGVFTVAHHVLGSRAAVHATVLWAALPVGIVQSMAYSESLFTALAAWALVAVLRERWLLAAVLACAAGATRPLGVAVVAGVAVPAALAWLRRPHRPTSRGPVLDPRLGAVVLAPLGLVGYLGWVGWERDSPTGYFEVTAGWGNGLDGGVAFTRWVAGRLTGPAPPQGVLLLLGLCVLVLLLARCVRDHQPLPLLLFSVVLVVVTFTTSGYFGSRPRYLLPAFPLLLPVAAWLGGRRTVVGAAVLVGATAVAAVYGAVWLLGPGPP